MTHHFPSTTTPSRWWGPDDVFKVPVITHLPLTELGTRLISGGV
jgi:hypothetical protein